MRAKFAYPDVTFRYAIAPSKSLPWNLEPLTLSEDQINDMITQGVNDAKAAVTQGTSVEDLIHYHSLKKAGDNRIDRMSLGDFAAARNQFEEYDMQKDHTARKFKAVYSQI